MIAQTLDFRHTSHLHDQGFQSIAIPLIGAGSGNYNQEKSKKLILDELSRVEIPITVKLVVFKPKK
jgi:O-acetyl-ADP-ribose deacetylase (regulator of RNase III)